MRRFSVAPAVAIFLALGACATQDGQQGALRELPPTAPSGPATIDLVDRAIADGRLNDATRLLDRLRLSQPETPRMRLAQAELSLASGAHKLAQDRFALLAGDAEVGPRAQQGLGIALLLQGQAQPGHDALQRAVAADAALFRAWNGLGFYYDSQQKFDLAEDAYGKAIAGNGTYALAFNNRGYSRMMQGEIDLALADLDRALALDPKLTVAQQNMRLAMAWQGNYAGALIGIALKDRGRTLNNVGYVAMLRGDLGAAESYFVQAMEADPTYNEVAARNLAYLKSVKSPPPAAGPARP